MFRRKREPSRIPNYLVLILLALFALVPVLLLALNSLRTTQEIGTNPFALPESWLFSNYAEAWDQGDFSTTMVNTVILTGGTIIGVVIIGGLAAFFLARFRFPLSRSLARIISMAEATSCQARSVAGRRQGSNFLSRSLVSPAIATESRVRRVRNCDGRGGWTSRFGQGQSTVRHRAAPVVALPPRSRARSHQRAQERPKCVFRWAGPEGANTALRVTERVWRDFSPGSRHAAQSNPWLVRRVRPMGDMAIGGISASIPAGEKRGR